MGITTTDDTVDRISNSPGRERVHTARPVADQPQTADQRLPLLVVLIASFFLLGVGAVWQPIEPNVQAASPSLVTKSQPVDAIPAASTDTAPRPEASATP